ncbi:MAG: holdfast anchoring protein HfaA [Phenylobacterium sp.]|jgi:holdfast attachment protein HfaA|uniref:holdfast anchoring protein HfaA n=1 Tax=Phenylobacterium sp. TaxID=1871053 RepID=UPI002733D1CA|nr:holdfast anchoring protein HfaA [Phenylobacterium sp.]MDP1641427.1 holdfast anchoring protein HfaA [Phenylobacterium sp.]MDP3118635.1 holdfast anchoring protein HfaA [Phenylobacterium sp.]MDP3383055.1 holdfast anchoring protein HfaA [Phenylobacterium sp.]
MALVTPVRPAAWLAAIVASLAGSGAAQAQQMTTNSADFNAGWGRYAGSENHPVDVSTRDANGNRVIVDGLILTGEDQSSFSRSWGSADAYAGVGASSGGSSAIGNNLVVVTQGNYNTVIVNSTQVNNGNVSAGTQMTSGGVGDAQ